MWEEHNLDPEWIEKITYFEYQIWLEKLNKAVEKHNREALEDSGKKEIFNFSR